MLRELYVTAFVTTASTLRDVTVGNTLFVTVDPNDRTTRVYWQGRQVTDIAVRDYSRVAFVARVIFEEQEVELGALGATFVYEGYSLTRVPYDAELRHSTPYAP